MRIIEEGDFPHAADWYSMFYSEIFAGFIHKGPSDQCEVTHTGFDITVGDGYVVSRDIPEKMTNVDDWYVWFGGGTKTVSTSDSDHRRYDLVYLEIQEDNVELVVDEGTPSEEPKHPPIPHPSSKHIILLAVLRIDAGSSEISEIKDCRSIREYFHDNRMHDPNYATEDDLRPHGNEEHSETFARLVLHYDKTVNIGAGNTNSTVLYKVDSAALVALQSGMTGDAEDTKLTYYLEDSSYDGTAMLTVKNEGREDAQNVRIQVFEAVTHEDNT